MRRQRVIDNHSAWPSVSNLGEQHKECDKEILEQRLSKPLIQHPDVLWEVGEGQ